jgi:hypothetical protein
MTIGPLGARLKVVAVCQGFKPPLHGRENDDLSQCSFLKLAFLFSHLMIGS